MREGKKNQYAWIKPGVLVDYHAVIGGPVTKAAMVVREPAQLSPGYQWVCFLAGKSGWVACDAVTPAKREGGVQ